MGVIVKFLTKIQRNAQIETFFKINHLQVPNGGSVQMVSLYNKARECFHYCFRQRSFPFLAWRDDAFPALIILI